MTQEKKDYLKYEQWKKERKKRNRNDNIVYGILLVLAISLFFKLPLINMITESLSNLDFIAIEMLLLLTILVIIAMFDSCKDTSKQAYVNYVEEFLKEQKKLKKEEKERKKLEEEFERYNYK